MLAGYSRALSCCQDLLQGQGSNISLQNSVKLRCVCVTGCSAEHI